MILSVKKNFFILLGSAFLLTNMSCKKIQELTQFDMSYNTKVTVPPTFGINTPFEILTPDINTNSDSEFSSRGTAKNYIDEEWA